MTAETPALTVGQQLQQARERRGLSQQQVAVQLNLKPEVVIKLEQDQLDGTLETYARGYVRAYARLMKLPEQELMAAYGKHSSEHSTAKPMRTFSNRAAHQATENRFMWLTYAIIALLLLLLFIWWWQSELNTPIAGAAQQAEAPAATVVVAEPDAAVAVSDVAEPAAVPQTSTEQMASMLAQLTDVSPQSSDAAPEPVQPLLDQLEMRFSANCWVNVVDAQGNRVAYGTKQSGYVMQLQGEAPFEVTLGNPSVVQINFNQQAVDMSSLPGGRVAKFSIPESE